MAAMRDVALHNQRESHIFRAWEDKQRGLVMGFFTEMFSRPRPQDLGRVRAGLALADAIGGINRVPATSKPADFPRMARELGFSRLG
jgi:hypothetical protein